MKLTAAAVVALLHRSSAFVPTPFTRSTKTTTTYHPRSSNTFARRAIIDPSILADAHHHADTLSNILSSFVVADGADLTDPITTIADAASSAVSATADAVSAAAPAVVETAAPVAPTIVEAAAPVAPAVVEAAATSSTVVAPAAADAAAAAAADPDNGWFGFLAEPLEFVLQGIHSVLTGVGISDNTWGIAIIILTALIKLVTYPLTVQQLESTSKMQAVSPMVKEIQAKYASNPEVMNQKVAAVYQDNQVNPLAGCLPALVTLPVFIGLYRAVLNLAAGDKFNEPFLWLPNLEGPTYGADPSSASSWLFSGWIDGVPPLGWDDTLAFLSIPVILVVTQFVTMEAMATKDQEQPAFLKFLPLFIGFISLGVPSALGVYWVANNLFTAALNLQIRASLKPVELASSSPGGSAVVDVQSTFTPAPIREKPSGFGASDWDEDGDGVKPITKTGPVDAEIVAKEDTVSEEETIVASSQGGGKKKNKKRGRKKRKKN